MENFPITANLANVVTLEVLTPNHSRLTRIDHLFMGILGCAMGLMGGYLRGKMLEGYLSKQLSTKVESFMVHKACPH